MSMVYFVSRHPYNNYFVMKKYSFIKSILRVCLVTAVFFLANIPLSTFASTNRPSCVLTVHTNIGTTTIQGKSEILLQKGSEIKLQWKSTNATKATDAHRDAISLSGVATGSPTRNSKFIYNFSNGSRKVTCEADVTLIRGSFATSTLTTNSTKPSISGKISGIGKIQVQIFKEGSTTPFYKSKILVVKNGTWKTVVSKTLPNGIYTINVLGVKNRVLNTVLSDTLSIGKKTDDEKKQSTTLIVQPIPLLLGGIAHGGKAVPVSYLQVINVGKNPAVVHSFDITQTGTAPVGSITGITIVDDSGSVGGSIGGIPGATPFKNTNATIPFEAAFAPGQMRLFTIKAILANIVSPYLNTQLRIVVSGITTNAASVKAVFPIQGTLWTIGM